MEQQKTESHSDQIIDVMNDEKKSQEITLKEATEILKLHNEWRRGAEIGMGNVTRLGEAIDFLTQYYVEVREEQAWTIIEEKVNDYIEEIKDMDKIDCSPYRIVQYLKMICHPPMLKNNNEGL
jgi:hypothetical protein